MTPQLQQLAQQIEQEFITGLQGLKLTPDEAALVSRLSQRIAQTGQFLIGAPPEQQQAFKDELALDLSSLADIGVTKQIDAVGVLRTVAQDALMKAIQIGLQVALGAVAA